MSSQVLFALVVLVLVSTTYGGIIRVIDDFRLPAPNTSPCTNGCAQVSANYPGTGPAVTAQVFANDASGGIVGNQRDLIITVYGRNAGTGDSNAYLGRWQINQGSNTFTDAVMQYDGADSSANLAFNAFNIDLRAGGATSLFLNYSSDGVFYVQFTFYSSSSSNYFRYNYTSQFDGTGTTEKHTANIPFTTIQAGAVGSPSLSSITAITYQFHAQAFATDTQFNTVATFGNTLTGRVWIDCNRNQIFDITEEGDCTGLTLTDLTAGGVQNFISDCITGNYLFGILAGNQYRLCIQQKTGYTVTFPTSLSSPPLDSQQCVTINTVSGFDSPNNNFGIIYGINFTIPSPATVSCTPTTARLPSSTGTATVNDYCGQNTTTYSDSSNPNCGSFLRTWRQSISLTVLGTQVITVTDTNVPTVFLPTPSGATVSCASFNSNPNIFTPGNPTAGTATASDTCVGPITPTFFDTALSGTCSRTFARTWTAGDGCGNSNRATQVFTVTDSSAPTLTAPLSTTVDCGTPTTTAVLGAGTATDDCASPPQINIVTSSLFALNTGTCTQTFTRTFTATDGCNPTAPQTQTITIRDTQPPQQQGSIPTSASISCTTYPTSLASLPVPTFTDCNLSGVTSFDQGPSTGCTPTYSRTFVATDACGQSTRVTTVVTIVDNAGPTITPPNLAVTLACTQRNSATILTPTLPAVVDNCYNPSTITFVDVSVPASSPFGCRSTITRTFTATDGNGCNTSTLTQQFVFTDVLPPTITPPANTVVDCSIPIASVPVDFGTATDACNAVSPGASSDNISTIPGACGFSGYIRTITWSDSCSNAATATYRIDFDDSTAPILNLPPDATVDCPNSIAPGDPAVGTATATDNCGTPTITYQDTTGDPCDAATSPYLRTWNAFDTCSNFALTQTQRIYYQDITNPTISVGDQTRECSDTTPFPQPTSADECSTTNVQSNVISGGPSGCFSNEVIVYTAFDACLNSADATQTITFQDTTQPSLTVPFDTTITCLAPTAPDALLPQGTATTSDNCQTPTLSYSDFFDPASDSCRGTIFRVWTASDGCTADVSDTQTIIVADLASPVLILPPNTQVACDVYPTAAVPSTLSTVGTATASDICQSQAPQITFNDSISGPPYCSSLLTRTWTAFDLCGTAADAVDTQLITVFDSVDPALFIPSDVTSADCSVPLTSTALGTATASDNCDTDPFVTFTDSTTGTCTVTTIRTWTATDNCFNQAPSQAQTITRTDTTDPILYLPPNKIVSCEDWNNNNLAVIGTATATDDCQFVSPVLQVTNQVPILQCPEQYFRVFTADDGCGNTDRETQTVTVTDTIPPFFQNFPPNRNLEACIDDQSVGANGSPVARDTCHSVNQINSLDSVTFSFTPVASCGFTFSRTFSVTDICGNAFAQTQLFTVRDTTAPTINQFGIGNTSVSCDQAIPVPNPTAADAANCNLVNPVTWADTPYDRGVCDRGILRTFNVDDVCGNDAIPYTQTIALVDTTAPTYVTFPADRTIECTDSIDPNINRNLGIPTISDTCDPDPSLTYRDSTQGAICPSGIIRNRTWIAFDDCNNQNIDTQVITILLTTPPDLIVPPAVVIECDDPSLTATDPTNTGFATATSPCLSSDEITVTYTDFVSEDACPITITRTWIAIDPCGNRSTDIQNIFIDDTTSPVWAYFPDDRVILCGSNPDLHPSVQGFPVALDNCVFPVCDVTWYDYISFEDPGPGTCPGDQIISRTWIATDDCGNFLADIQTLTIEFHDPQSACPPFDCPAEPCELCECPLIVCQCCKDLSTSCTSVPCEPVACTTVDCAPVDCIPCPTTDNDRTGVLPPCGPEIPCIPNIIPQFVDDDDAQYVDEGESVATEAREYWRDQADYWRHQAIGAQPQNGDTSIAPLVALIVLLVTLPITVFLNLN